MISMTVINHNNTTGASIAKNRTFSCFVALLRILQLILLAPALAFLVRLDNNNTVCEASTGIASRGVFVFYIYWSLYFVLYLGDDPWRARWHLPVPRPSHGHRVQPRHMV